MSEQGNIPIAEDLRYVYSEASVDPPRPARKWPLRARDNVIRHSIERISRAEANIVTLQTLVVAAREERDELRAEVAQLKAENERLKEKSYRNMCRDEHMQIGFEGEDFAPCPVCQLQRTVERLKAPVMLPERYKFGMDASCAMAVDALLTARTGGSNGK